MKNIWLISDTHFFDADMLIYKDANGNKIRPFSSVEEMNEVICEKWRAIVKPEDRVWHLGDVFSRNGVGKDRKPFEDLWFSLPGHKKLVVGNHDPIGYLSGKSADGRWFFDDAVLFQKLTDFNIFLSHAPQHETTLYSSKFPDKLMMNVHGHIHSSIMEDSNYINVCVEQTNFEPINIDSIRSKRHG